MHVYSFTLFIMLLSSERLFLSSKLICKPLKNIEQLKNSDNFKTVVFLPFSFCIVYSCILLSLSSVQLLSHVWHVVVPWTATCQASPSITNYCSVLKLMPIESVMPFNHLILCHPLLLLPSIFPSIRVFSKESVLCIMFSNPAVNKKSSGHLYLKQYFIFQEVKD